MRHCVTCFPHEDSFSTLLTIKTIVVRNQIIIQKKHILGCIHCNTKEEFRIALEEHVFEIDFPRHRPKVLFIVKPCRSALINPRPSSCLSVPGGEFTNLRLHASRPRSSRSVGYFQIGQITKDI